MNFAEQVYGALCDWAKRQINIHGELSIAAIGFPSGAECQHGVSHTSKWKLFELLRDDYRDKTELYSLEKYFVILPGQNDDAINELKKNLLKYEQEFDTHFCTGISRLSTDSTGCIEDACRALNAAILLHKKGGVVNYRRELSGVILNDIIKHKHRLTKCHFEVYLQPKRMLDDDSVASYEALIRLIDQTNSAGDPEVIAPNHKVHRFGNFLQSISAHHMQQDFDHWLLDEVQPYTAKGLKISVNLPAGSINQSLKSYLLNNFDNDSLKNLEIEILEHEVLTPSSKAIISFLNAQYGVMFALDDFGVGVSNITLLEEMPQGSFVKIDKSFVYDGQGTPTEKMKKTQLAISKMAYAYGHNIVFEGVEDTAVREGVKLLIKSAEIPTSSVLLQGYYNKGKPTSASNLLVSP